MCDRIVRLCVCNERNYNFLQISRLYPVFNNFRCPFMYASTPSPFSPSSLLHSKTRAIPLHTFSIPSSKSFITHSNKPQTVSLSTFTLSYSPLLRDGSDGHQHRPPTTNFPFLLLLLSLSVIFSPSSHGMHTCIPYSSLRSAASRPERRAVSHHHCCLFLPCIVV
jgi:hypothetical protein